MREKHGLHKRKQEQQESGILTPKNPLSVDLEPSHKVYKSVLQGNHAYSSNALPTGIPGGGIASVGIASAGNTSVGMPNVGGEYQGKINKTSKHRKMMSAWNSN